MVECAENTANLEFRVIGNYRGLRQNWDEFRQEERRRRHAWIRGIKFFTKNYLPRGFNLLLATTLALSMVPHQNSMAQKQTCIIKKNSTHRWYIQIQNTISTLFLRCII